MTTQWYVVEPTANIGKNLSGAKVLSAVVGSPLQTALDAGQASGGLSRVEGPYQTEVQAAVELANLTSTSAAGGIAGTSPGVLGGIVQGIKSPLTGLNAVGDFFQRLSQAATWLRILEVVLGVSLIAIGIAKMSGISPGKVAKGLAL